MDAALVHGQTEFTVELYKAVVKKEESKNAVLSPLSIGITMAMASAGAKGPTLEQIESCVKLPHEFSAQLKNVVLADGSEAGGPQLAVANRVWVEQSIQLKPAYQKVLKNSYGSEAASVDFLNKPEEALGKVNTWAKEETHGKIEDLLPPGSVNNGTRLVLANALYFKGAWDTPFEEENTKEGDFFLLDGKSIKVPMMHSYYRDMYVENFPTFKALRLPYRQGRDRRQFSMFILLPHDKKGLPKLEKNLDVKVVAEDLKSIRRAVPLSRFELPKFKISSSFQVPEALMSLGLTLPFGDDADFADMVESKLEQGLYISDVCHKGFVEVNEQGTEAAAATAAIVMMKCISFDESIDFVADHPFLFLIMEESTNIVVFTGRVTDPSVAN